MTFEEFSKEIARHELTVLRDDGLYRHLRCRRPDDRAIADVDMVFLCRSGAWLPPWCDDAFFRFVNAAPVQVIPLAAPPKHRGFQMSHAEALSGEIRKFMIGHVG